MIRFLTDEDFNRAILEGIRLRLPSLDVIRVQDAGLRTFRDPQILEYGARENRIVLSHDFGTMERNAHGKHAFIVEQPLLRGGNADLNMTFAMAAIFMVLWLIWALRSNGIWGFTLHLFGPKGESTGFIKYMMIVVFFAVGFLEVISIAFRPISLSFRLYGNVFAGENLLEAMSNTVQHPAWAKAVFSVLIPVPFYFLEILIGLVQAFVFMLLTTVFTALICTHEEEHVKGQH